MKKVAIICANGLGDGLIYMVLAHNLQKAGYSVTTFSSPLVGLKEWFPSKMIDLSPNLIIYTRDSLLLIKS